MALTEACRLVSPINIYEPSFKTVTELAMPNYVSELFGSVFILR